LTDEEAAMASDRDDRRAAATALASLQRLADLGPALVLPAHGPLPAHPDAALQAAFRRAKRLVDDPDGAAWYGARRVFAYALMIYDGIPAEELDQYLRARAWFTEPPSCSASPKTTWPANSSAPRQAAAPSSSPTARSALPHGTPPWTSESSTSLIQRAGRDALS